MSAFAHILEQSLLFLPLAFGIFISYRILKTTDLTVDGSFVLGAAVFARFASAGSAALFSQFAAIGAGALAGVAVSFVQRRVNPLLAGILVLFVLHSVNLQVMSRPNIGLSNLDRLPHSPLALAVAAILLAVALIFLLHSKGGLLLRALGNNARLLRMQGRPTQLLRTLGLALSNALVAYCGAMTAQVNGYADVQMGFGMVMIGIGTVVLGQQIVQRMWKPERFLPSLEVLGCALGVLLYFAVLHLCLAYGVDPVYLKMLVGLALIGTMMFAEAPHGAS